MLGCKGLNTARYKTLYLVRCMRIDFEVIRREKEREREEKKKTEQRIVAIFPIFNEELKLVELRSC